MIGALMAPLRPAFWRSRLAEREARAFDRRYGVDTLVQLPVAEMQDVAPALAAHAVHYEASAIPKFRRALRVVARRLGPALRDYEFVDVGSGKGLVVMLASMHPFRRIIGIEISPQLHHIAEMNVRRFRAARNGAAPISLRCEDAFCLALPGDGRTIVYLYNPFDETFTARFLEKLVTEAPNKPAAVLIIYVNPVHRRLFDAHPRLRVLHAHRSLAVYEIGGRDKETAT